MCIRCALQHNLARHILILLGVTYSKLFLPREDMEVAVTAAHCDKKHQHMKDGMQSVNGRKLHACYQTSS